TETKLGPGEHVATNPQMPDLPIANAIEWSREAQTLLSSVPLRETFEESSIRLKGPMRPNAFTQACNGGSAVDVNPGRFAISGKNIYTLITMAYSGGGNLVQGCLYANWLGLLTGGPEWILTDAYEIQAVIPAGSFSSAP